LFEKNRQANLDQRDRRPVIDAKLAEVVEQPFPLVKRAVAQLAVVVLKVAP
jgi:hypothetical protein